MQFGIGCMECLFQRHARLARSQGDRDTGIDYMKEIMGAMADAPEGVAAPWLTPVFARITEKYYGSDAQRYQQAKETSNRMMLELLPGLRARVETSANPLLTALLLARTCNYIDYTAFAERVNRPELEQLLSHCAASEADREEYARFCRDMAAASKLVYICDNAGEIMADRLAAEVLHRQFPHTALVFAVRGAPAVNDALREDALLAGLEQFGRIIDNGSGISGVELGWLGQEMAQALDSADVILAKGQGNFETMLGCGKNVYYLFLCKCPRFTEMFGVPLLTGMFVNERRLPRHDFSD